MTPLFLLSLPRSGSSYLQRVIGGHEQIATVGEPYIALGQYALLDESIYSRFGSRTIRSGQRSLCEQLPGSRDAFLREQGKFCESIYGMLGGEGRNYFLDKSPRNAAIGTDLLTMFPGGKFLILWRNPLSVIASTYTTWGTGMRALEMMRVDWHLGFRGLAELSKLEDERVMQIRYDDVLSDEEKLRDRIGEFLGLDLRSSGVLEVEEVKGYLGDPGHVLDAVREESPSDEKWKKVLVNPVRKGFARRILQSLPDEDLAAAGYPKDELLEALRNNSGTARGTIRDLFHLLLGKLGRRFHLYVFLNERRLRRKGRPSLAIY